MEKYSISEAAKQAAEQEDEAKAQPDASVYTHVFKTPFVYGEKTYEKLTFDWGRLTGRDSLSIERELLRSSITVVIAEYTPEYLAQMALRACTEWDNDEARAQGKFILNAMPLRDFRKICNAARRFLLHAES